MIKRILILLLFLTGVAYAQEKPLTAGMKINRSAKIKKAIYQLDAHTLKNDPVIIIEGKNITIDFNNAELRGSRGKLSPDQFTGTAIIIRNSSNITIKNLKARGYKIALKATNVEKLVLDNCDLSYNYRQHLNSTQEKEDISDWMSYHHNEKDEWLRYGAAIYLDSCNAFTVKNCIVTGGQNALMMTQCNNGWVYNNDFSFNSGIGIGMYRSSGNNIMYNKVVFNVRGYSHGVYSRGQDSAGILVYEQSSDNLFYRNNVTHGGDGFFLWAGQTTMDNGTGGCNNNRIIKNDFSYAPTNGIEVTFSSNQILNNRIYECDHGIWGGYSYDSRIAENSFRNNRIGIAIEHGQNIGIHHNQFFNDKEGIRLWARKQQPADWGYAQKRDTRSRNYGIAMNTFGGLHTVFNITNTDSVNVFDNIFSRTDSSQYVTDSSIAFTQITYGHFSDVWNNYILDDTLDPVIPVIPFEPNDPFVGTGKRAGRKNIRITEWGPYDFRSPLIWNTNPTDTSRVMQFDLIGPKGKWVIKKASGVTDISAMSGEFPASITAIKLNDKRTDINIELQYTGEAIVTPMGQTIAAGKPYTFSFKKFFQPVDWGVLFYSLDTAHYNPITKGSLFSPTERKAPFKTDHVKELNYAWWGGIKEKE
ncbi:MAG TPA: right-handed parallel beta-helix repeat-containing protein, partial [Chitinophagaceae bacterium]|nr:right-handed parallel beta-helix repeat-containing protein [Chitinophagaceae bacterium]